MTFECGLSLCPVADLQFSMKSPENLLQSPRDRLLIDLIKCQSHPRHLWIYPAILKRGERGRIKILRNSLRLSWEPPKSQWLTRACNPSIWEDETVDKVLKAHLELCSELKDSPSYMTSWLKKNETKLNKQIIFMALAQVLKIQCLPRSLFTLENVLSATHPPMSLC